MEVNPATYLASQGYVGGLPERHDRAPSIAFLVFYVLLLLWGFRTEERTWPIFQVIRIATFVLRLGLASSWWGSSTQVIIMMEAALLGVGFFVLAGGLALQRCRLNIGAHPRLRSVRSAPAVIMAVFRWIYVICGGIEVAAAAIAGVYLYNHKTQLRDTPRLLRRVSTITGLSVACIVFAAAFCSIHTRSNHRIWPSLAVCATAAALTVAAAFAVAAFQKPVSWVAYYVLHASAEVFTLGSLLFVPGDWYTAAYVCPLPEATTSTTTQTDRPESLVPQVPSIPPDMNKEAFFTPAPMMFTVCDEATGPMSKHKPVASTSGDIDSPSGKASHLSHPPIDLQQLSIIPTAIPAGSYPTSNVVSHGRSPRADMALPASQPNTPVVSTIMPWWQRRKG